MKIKVVIIFLLAGLLIVSCQNGQNNKKSKSEITTTADKVSYSIGQNIGKNLKMQGIEYDADLLIQGIKDASNDTSLFTDAEINEIMTAFQSDLQAKQQKKNQESAVKNKTEGEKFLEENKNKEGVVELPSGLQYKVISSGSGATPKASDKVTVNYKGRLLNGKEFDSSYKRNKPATFQVKGVIPGWTEILQKMKVGDKWEVYIPSNLAYGERGSGPVIGPNETLIFEIELLGINK